jgi:uncharacterized protein (DUF697 family)
VASVSLRKIWGAVSEARSHATRSVRLVGNPSDIESFARALAADGARTGELTGDAPGGERAAAVLRMLAPGALPGSRKELRDCSLVVFVARAGRDAPEALRAPVGAVREADVPLLLVLLDAASVDAGVWVASDVFFAQEVAVLRPGEALRDSEVARSIAGLARDGAVPLAARLPALRPAVVDRIIAVASRQNGVIGAVVFIPGADMPVMTVNQVRMVLQIAAAYDERVGLERAIEILSIVGIGYGFRTVARQALSYVPGPGWMIKGGFGYAATTALGKAAVRYFEEGAPLRTSRVRRLTEKIGKINNPLSGRGSFTG